MAKLGIIARMDKSGLGNQTRSLCYMLNPDKVMVVDSTSFNNNKQHPEWYKPYNAQFTAGWPTTIDCANFMQGLTHVLTAETVYNNHIFWLAQKYGVKVFIQPNWEFLDHINKDLPQPYGWLMPSYWHLEDMKRKFGNTVYLPPPLFLDDFTDARDTNIHLSGKRNFLHVVGRAASHDRNGTLDVIRALEYSKADYRLTIRSQFPLGEEYYTNDPRVEIVTDNVEKETDMYRGYDLFLMPRRYAGLCLPMNEALASALPVVMPDISPNNQILPSEWLVSATVKETFTARTPIAVYSSDLVELGSIMDNFANMSGYDLLSNKLQAYGIAQKEYSSEELREKYIKILGLKI